MGGGAANLRQKGGTAQAGEKRKIPLLRPLKILTRKHWRNARSSWAKKIRILARTGKVTAQGVDASPGGEKEEGLDQIVKVCYGGISKRTQ